MAIGNITFNGAAYYNGCRLPSSGWYGSSQPLYAGYSNNGWHAACLRFTTPAFSTSSADMTVTLGIVMGGSGGNTTVPLRWAVSTTNDLNYYLGSGASSDPGIIAQGTYTCTGLNAQVQNYQIMSSASTPGMSGSSTYYLYVWAGSSSSAGQFVQIWGYGNCSGAIAWRDSYNIGVYIAGNSSGYITSVSGGGNVTGSTTLRANVANGAYFTRWVDGDYVTRSTSNPWTFTPTYDYNYYAEGKGKTYTITYNANGGSGAPSAQSYVWAPSGSTNLSSTIPIRTGYTFLGWSRTQSATSPEYSAGLAWSLSNAGNYTLYAVWRINTYTNTVDNWLIGLNSGDGNNSTKTALALPDDSFTANYGSSYRLTANRSSIVSDLPNGVYFSGQSEGIGYTHPDGDWYNDPINTTVTQPANAVTYQYNFRATTYNITYNLNGGTNNSSNPSSYNVLYGITFASPTPPTGYTFDHWEIDGQTVTGINPGKNASNFKNLTYTQLKSELASRTIGDKTVTAIYSGNYVQINTSVTPSGAGTVEGAGSYLYGDQCTLTATATSGYVFDHWELSGSNISSNNLYTFQIDDVTTQNYVAVFSKLSPPILVFQDPVTLGQLSHFTISSQSTVTLDLKIVIILNTRSLQISDYDTDHAIGNFTLPIDWSSELPDGSSGTALWNCESYDNEVLIGTTSGSFTILVPSTEVPVINSVNYIDSTDVYNHFNVFVADKSILTAVINAKPASGTTITEYRTQNYDGTEIVSTNNSFILGKIPNSFIGTHQMVSQITDSRNRIATYNSTLNISEYILPKINNFAITWSNILDSDGNVVSRQPLIAINITIGSVTNSSVIDEFALKISYRLLDSGTDFTTIYTSNTINQNYSDTLSLTGSSYPSFDPNNSYIFKLDVIDYFETISQSLTKLNRTNFTICSNGTLKVGTLYQNQSTSNILAYLDSDDGVFDVKCKDLSTSTGSNVIFKSDGSIICDNLVESGH